MSHWLKIKVVVKFLFLYQRVLRNCSICLENIHFSELHKTDCNHSFHKECIKKWNKSNCPVCRQNSKKESPIKFEDDYPCSAFNFSDLGISREEMMRLIIYDESRILNGRDSLLSGIGGISFSN